MKVAEKIFIVLVLIALLMKFNLVPGHSLLLIISLMGLSSIYFYFGFIFFNGIRLRKIFKKESYIGISGLRITYAVLSGLSFSALTIGILFKFMRWPGSAGNIIVGLGSLICVLILAIIKYSANKEKIYQRMIIRAVPFMIVGISLLFISADKIFEFQFRGHDAYIKAYYECEKDYMNEEKYNKRQLEYDRATLSDEDFKLAHPEEK